MNTPEPAALDLIPQTMAEVYKVLPLRYENRVLTVAIGEGHESIDSVQEDLRNLLGLVRVECVIWPDERVKQGMAEAYVDREFDVGAWIRRIEAQGPT